jgi:hypothetical protein
MVQRWNSVRNFWCFLTERFVGWLTNFIHDRHAVHINMLRGWSASSFSHAVSFDIKEAISAKQEARGTKPAKRGFLLSAVDKVNKRRKVTMKGKGDIGYTAHNKNSSMIVAAHTHDLNTCIATHAHQLGLPAPHQLPTRVLKLTSGVRINGRPWKKGSMCFYYLPTDRRLDDTPRVGEVQYFVATTIHGTQHLFVCLDQRPIVDTVLSIIVYDITQPVSLKFFHVDHLTHLAGSVPFWHAGRPDLRCGVPIAPTI